MGMENGYSLSDVAAATRGADGFGGGTDSWVLIILFALIFGGGGFGFGNNSRIAGQPVTEAGLCNAMNFNNLENAVGRLSDSLSSDYMGLQNGICDLGYETLRNFNTTQQQIAECCCATQRSVDSVNYNGAINTASIQASNAENTQKILDAITGNRMADMQNQINQLQLQAALGNVVRYPTTSAYCSGSNPFCGCSNGCNI